MTWLSEAASNPKGQISSSRVINLAAGFSLSLSNALLTIGSFWHIEMLATLSVLAPTLGALAGGSYMMNRWTAKDGKNEPV